MSGDGSIRIVIDDTGPEINYAGPWFTDSTGIQDYKGNFGPSYRSTLHGTRSNASFTFQFNGTAVVAHGSNDIITTNGTTDPEVECFIDNISVGSRDPFPYVENNWWFCSKSNLVDGFHTLSVNVTVRRNQTFWFDSVYYQPSEDVNLEGKTIEISHSDRQLQYGSGWEALRTEENITTIAGSDLQYEFYGVSVSWWGTIPVEWPGTPTTGTYSVDGQAPKTFLLKGYERGEGDPVSVYNNKFFETPVYEMGKHNLTVVFQGSEDTTPLTLHRLLVLNGTLPHTHTASTPSHQPTSSSSVSSTPVQQHSTNVGAIIGGIIGGLAGVAILILALFRLCRRSPALARIIDKAPSSSNTMIEPFYIPNRPSVHPSGSSRLSSTWDTLRQNRMSYPEQTQNPLYPLGRLPDTPYSPAATGPILVSLISATGPISPKNRSCHIVSTIPESSIGLNSERSGGSSSRQVPYINTGTRGRAEANPALETVEEIPPQYSLR